MAYYDILFQAWKAKTVPAGATGADLVDGMSLQQKCDTVNAWTVPGETKSMRLSAGQLFNAFDPAEFDALDDKGKARIRDVLNLGDIDASPGTHVAAILDALFPDGSASRALLDALALTFATRLPWWQAVAMLKSAINVYDAEKAGLN